MPKKETATRARQAKKKEKAPATQAGEFIREEIEEVRAGKHGVRNTKQAIAIGLSKARRAGLKVAPPEKGAASEKVRKQAKRDLAKGAQSTGRKPVYSKRSPASTKALRKEGRSSVSKAALSKQSKSAARKRGPLARSAAAIKAVRTRAKAKK